MVERSIAASTFNYHHLRLFWAVAREGNLTRAAAQLQLTPQTVSAQIRALEGNLAQALFRRANRRLTLTEAGEVVLDYANSIFELGEDLRQKLRGQAAGRMARLVIGVADVMPKVMAFRLIAPVLRLDRSLRIVCRESTAENLLADLAVHKIDVVLADSPIPPGLRIRAYNHELGSCGATLLARRDLARRLRPGFPQSLDGGPLLLPGSDSRLRQELEAWCERCGIRPRIPGELDDSALLKVFGQAGIGAFAVPTVVADEIAAQFEVEPIGPAEGVVVRFYAISTERHVRHPAVAAIRAGARDVLPV
jgi:LysR family transcriptional activator of nhaA